MYATFFLLPLAFVAFLAGGAVTAPTGAGDTAEVDAVLGSLANVANNPTHFFLPLAFLAFLAGGAATRDAGARDMAEVDAVLSLEDDTVL